MRSVAASVAAMLQCTVPIADGGSAGGLYSVCPAWPGYLSATDGGAQAKGD
jgi:hypothetical protein